jgi:uncharacterized protein (TIGR02284 family)
MGRISSLAELVAVLLDGIAFYEQAAERALDARLVDFFLRMAYLKKTIAAALTSELAHRGEPAAESGDARSALRQAYAGLLATVGGADAPRWIAELEQHEILLLYAFRDACAEDAPERVRALARQHLPEVHRMHGEMERLKAGYD